eukprot:COSAG02_NODE_66_length_42609_cov_95.996848_4_plen_84_part_00
MLVVHVALCTAATRALALRSHWCTRMAFRLLSTDHMGSTRMPIVSVLKFVCVRVINFWLAMPAACTVLLLKIAFSANRLVSIV